MRIGTLNEYAEKEIEYILGNCIISKKSRKLLRQVIVLGRLLNKSCFIESSQYLRTARDYMVRDLRKINEIRYEKNYPILKMR
jgi:hypothetical protein